MMIFDILEYLETSFSVMRPALGVNSLGRPAVLKALHLQIPQIYLQIH